MSATPHAPRSNTPFPALFSHRLSLSALSLFKILLQPFPFTIPVLLSCHSAGSFYLTLSLYIHIKFIFSAYRSPSATDPSGASLMHVCFSISITGVYRISMQPAPLQMSAAVCSPAVPCHLSILSLIVSRVKYYATSYTTRLLKACLHECNLGCGYCHARIIFASSTSYCSLLFSLSCKLLLLPEIPQYWHY